MWKLYEICEIAKYDKYAKMWETEIHKIWEMFIKYEKFKNTKYENVNKMRSGKFEASRSN
jgi:hypothetical protein